MQLMLSYVLSCHHMSLLRYISASSHVANEEFLKHKQLLTAKEADIFVRIGHPYNMRNFAKAR